MPIPAGLITALPGIIGLIGSIFGKKKSTANQTQYAAQEDPMARALRQALYQQYIGKIGQRTPQQKIGQDVMGSMYSRYFGQPFSMNSPAIGSYAAGGIVTQPQIASVGEAGPEAIVPLGPYGSTPPGVQPVGYSPGIMGMIAQMVNQKNRRPVTPGSLYRPR